MAPRAELAVAPPLPDGRWRTAEEIVEDIDAMDDEVIDEPVEDGAEDEDMEQGEPQ